MAADKDFIVKNGLEVNQDLIYADADIDKVGIGTTTPQKKLVVIGSGEVSEELSVGGTFTAEKGTFTGIMTANAGYDIGAGGTFISASVFDKKIGINSSIPVYTMDLYGPVSTGETAAYIYGDVEVTGTIKGNQLQGQISAGGTVGFTNVTVDNKLIANDAEVYTNLKLEEFNNDTFRFLTTGDPAGIGFTQNTDDPVLYFVRGKNYRFQVDSAGFPFYIKTSPTTGALTNLYEDGVEGNGAEVGIVTFKVPFDAPNVLYYQASNVSGMGGTIYLNNDQQTNKVGILTITTFLDSDTQADFEQIYVSGIGTVNDLRGPNNFSVSSGILTVRQDQTALIGVSTGADRINVDESNSNTNFQVLFSTNQGAGYERPLIDSGNTFTYNPSTNTLNLDTIDCDTVLGISTGANNINIDEKNDDTDYQVTFSDQNSAGYQRQYIDTNNSHLVYNPSDNELKGLSELNSTNIDATTVTATDFIGQASNATNVNLRERNTTDATHYITFGTSTSGNQRINTDSGLTYNPNSNTVTSSTFVGDLSGTATNADFINVDEKGDNVDYQVLFSTNQGASYQRPYIDTQSGQFKYNPSTNTLTAANIAGAGDNITNLDGANISQGVIDEARLPNASTTAQGVVQLENTWPPTSTSTTKTATTNVSRRLYDFADGIIPENTVMLFYQGSAPTGWTKLTTENNKALRVVKGTGGTTGGSGSFTATFSNERIVPLPRHNHTASSDNQSNNHRHSVEGETGNNNRDHSHTAETTSNGSHNHTITDDGHSHGITDPKHNHGVDDPGHNHSYSAPVGNAEYGNRGDNSAANERGDFVSGNRTTGISIKNKATGITINSGTTGISIRSTNSGHSHTISVGNQSQNHKHAIDFETGLNSGNHNHEITVDNEGTSGAVMDFQVAYINVILAKKN